jgi:hypothetical protein
MKLGHFKYDFNELSSQVRPRRDILFNHGIALPLLCPLQFVPVAQAALVLVEGFRIAYGYTGNATESVSVPPLPNSLTKSSPHFSFSPRAGAATLHLHPSDHIPTNTSCSFPCIYG